MACCRRTRRRSARNGCAPAARTAERGLLDAVLLGPGFGGARLRSSGAVDRVRLDALPAMASLIALTERIGLGAALRCTMPSPTTSPAASRRLDRLSGGRSAWIAQGFAAGDRADAFNPAGHAAHGMRRIPTGQSS
ncbi:MAG: hypothetical protein WDN49_06680 [Acetobacteraceae bacterium]